MTDELENRDESAAGEMESAPESAPAPAPALETVSAPAPAVDGGDGDPSAAAATAKRAARRNYIRREVWEWTKAVVTALILAVFIKINVVQAYKIPTGSMAPTIMPGDKVFGNRFVYKVEEPQRGDIIAFKPPPQVNSTTSFLKRIIAVGNDTVGIIDGVVYLNGRPLDEPYVMDFDTPDYAVTKVPEGYVFVMGDNRNNSHDSRFWGFQNVEDIQAKAFFRFWPPGRIGRVR